MAGGARVETKNCDAEQARTAEGVDVIREMRDSVLYWATRFPLILYVVCLNAELISCFRSQDV